MPINQWLFVFLPVIFSTVFFLPLFITQSNTMRQAWWMWLFMNALTESVWIMMWLNVSLKSVGAGL